METKILNEQTIIYYFENEIYQTTFDKVQHIVSFIEAQELSSILEVVPSYRSVMINIDTTIDVPKNVITQLNIEGLDLNSISNEIKQTRIINIPVLYGNEHGPDLEEVAQHNNLSKDDVVNIHSSNSYLIYLLGFMPGFPFLGGLSKKIHTPRRSEPRTKIPAGSVGIANNQTGLYPKQSPGGWQIIGQTPIDVFNINREPMCLYQPGDYIKFYSITLEEFEDFKVQQQNNIFDYERLVTIENGN
ncbi:5-oxoprolinase subunit PxpB [Staphylococcus durrellii]|uniref:5-oxoprolinase subunit PxpB n=1 Tax=Staphylococcus durrellii TaxID=2781773 RepID=UPI00189E11E6|nr:5-oxoprolinase subunit PxpB [Staphylococcus durrellii]MBF7016960.1 5-oxoprolinase subunit PxpB [Staphylococcus durrellii]